MIVTQTVSREYSRDSIYRQNLSHSFEFFFPTGALFCPDQNYIKDKSETLTLRVFMTRNDRRLSFFVICQASHPIKNNVFKSIPSENKHLRRPKVQLMNISSNLSKFFPCHMYIARKKTPHYVKKETQIRVS